jgi:ubiquinone/menaquinone biosynthesis C-methylase UbiE
MHTSHIADDYDEFFASNRLFELDQEIVARHVRPPGLVLDLGCGTGRALVPLARRGLRGLAVDLSEDMLRIVQEKAAREDLSIQCVRANIVELDWLCDASVDCVLCLFSTLGMVQGAENRIRVLQHARRALRPGGLLVLHVHNFWFSRHDADGPWWLVQNLLRSAVRRDTERGDKYFAYRGIPQMFLHVFTYRELRRMVRRAGFRVREVMPLNASRRQCLRWPWFFGSFRANGWILVGQDAGD